MQLSKIMVKKKKNLCCSMFDHVRRRRNFRQGNNPVPTMQLPDKLNYSLTVQWLTFLVTIKSNEISLRYLLLQFKSLKACFTETKKSVNGNLLKNLKSKLLTQN